MTHLLYHTPGWPPESLARALAEAAIEVRRTDHLNLPAVPPGRLAVLLLDPGARPPDAEAADRLSRLAEQGYGLVALGAPGETDPPEGLAQAPLSAFVSAGAGPRQLLVALRTGFREALARQELETRTSEVTELTDIGIKLATEKNYHTLLDQILFQARRITQSDAGSLYLVESLPDGTRRLHFKLTQNASRPDIPFVEFTMPLDQASLAGYAAITGEALAIEDVYALPPDAGYSFNRSFDEGYGYRTKSMLVVPMANHTGEVIGVLQLINRKRDAAASVATPAEAEQHVVPYSAHLIKLGQSLAGQAAVALENSQLYEAIERLFEGFVLAAVDAIEQRDPATSGHSNRVAALTVELARVVDVASDGPFRETRFSPAQVREIRYASLLHDFGKVGVREHVLVKEKKLYPSDLALIKQRHAFMVRTAQWEFERARAEYLAQHGRADYPAFLERQRAAHEAELERLSRFLQLVLESNEPSVLPEGTFEQLQEYAATSYLALDGAERPMLGPDEVRFLSIRKGSLDEEERLAIQRHVTHTFDFLRQIPWTKDLVSVPDIAHGHHEKLDGSGYPLGVAAARIPVQTRMMTISDIFDALTAGDRPYKRALPPDRALGIMEDEVRQGMLDDELFRLFVAAQVFQTDRPW